MYDGGIICGILDTGNKSCQKILNMFICTLKQFSVTVCSCPYGHQRQFFLEGSSKEGIVVVGIDSLQQSELGRSTLSTKFTVVLVPKSLLFLLSLYKFKSAHLLKTSIDNNNKPILFQ